MAIETADIALMTGDLGKIPEAVATSRATLANMRQNLVIALATVAGLMAGVFAGKLHIAGGMLIHQLSVLVVIANGMRLLRIPRGRQADPSLGLAGQFPREDAAAAIARALTNTPGPGVGS